MCRNDIVIDWLCVIIKLIYEHKDTHYLTILSRSNGFDCIRSILHQLSTILIISSLLIFYYWKY